MFVASSYRMKHLEKSRRHLSFLEILVSLPVAMVDSVSKIPSDVLRNGHLPVYFWLCPSQKRYEPSDISRHTILDSLRTFATAFFRIPCKGRGFLHAIPFGHGNVFGCYMIYLEWSLSLLKDNPGLHGVAQWLRTCATSRKVVVSRPDEVNGFFQFT
jgi:hypothetical protein